MTSAAHILQRGSEEHHSDDPKSPMSKKGSKEDKENLDYEA